MQNSGASSDARQRKFPLHELVVLLEAVRHSKPYEAADHATWVARWAYVALNVGDDTTAEFCRNQYETAVHCFLREQEERGIGAWPELWPQNQHLRELIADAADGWCRFAKRQRVLETNRPVLVDRPTIVSTTSVSPLTTSTRVHTDREGPAGEEACAVVEPAPKSTSLTAEEKSSAAALPLAVDSGGGSQTGENSQCPGASPPFKRLRRFKAMLVDDDDSESSDDDLLLLRAAKAQDVAPTPASESPSVASKSCTRMQLSAKIGEPMSSPHTPACGNGVALAASLVSPDSDSAPETAVKRVDRGMAFLLSPDSPETPCTATSVRAAALAAAAAVARRFSQPARKKKPAATVSLSAPSAECSDIRQSSQQGTEFETSDKVVGGKEDGVFSSTHTGQHQKHSHLCVVASDTQQPTGDSLESVASAQSRTGPTGSKRKPLSTPSLPSSPSSETQVNDHDQDARSKRPRQADDNENDGTSTDEEDETARDKIVFQVGLARQPFQVSHCLKRDAWDAAAWEVNRQVGRSSFSNGPKLQAHMKHILDRMEKDPESIPIVIRELAAQYNAMVPSPTSSARSRARSASPASSTTSSTKKSKKRPNLDQASDVPLPTAREPPAHLQVELSRLREAIVRLADKMEDIDTTISKLRSEAQRSEPTVAETDKDKELAAARAHTAELLEKFERERQEYRTQNESLVALMRAEREAQRHETKTLLGAIDRERKDRRDEFVAMANLIARSVDPTAHVSSKHLDDEPDPCG